MNHERRDELDFILDAALRDYSNRAPRAGLEGRILAGIQSAPPIRLWSAWIGWATAVAILLALIIAGHGRPKVQPLPQVSRVVQPPAQPSPPAPVRRAVKIILKRGKLPELETFPAPDPLTPEERALLRFAGSEPEQAHELFANSAQMKDLTIDPLQIEALPVETKE